MQSDKFNLEFTTLYHEIEANLNRIKSPDCENAKQLLDANLERFNELKEKLDLNGVHLPQYVRRTSQEKINQLTQLLNEAKNVIQPKKTFKFSSRRPPIRSNLVEKDAIQSSGDRLDSESNADLNNKETVAASIGTFHGLKDKNDEHLKLESDEVNGRDIQLYNLENCQLDVFGNPSTVHIINCKNSKINIGPVSTSIFIDKCTNNVFQLFCQQLRVHNTYDSLFYLHVCTRGIIEDSSRLKFDVYAFTYDQLDEHIGRSKLDRSINNWNKIEDFNWLVKNKQSPNWELLK